MVARVGEKITHQLLNLMTIRDISKNTIIIEIMKTIVAKEAKYKSFREILHHLLQKIFRMTM